MIQKIFRHLYYLFLKKWSYKTREKYARSIGVQVGKDCRILGTNFGSEPYLISLGDHVAIASGVRFINHDGGVRVFRKEYPDIDFIRPIIIYDNCVIGGNAIILPGVTIGPNCVIGAGSVVAKPIPPNTIAAGVPAKVISTMDRYQRRIDDKFFTFGMSRKKKRKYLLSFFGTSVDKWLAKVEELDGEINSK